MQNLQVDPILGVFTKHGTVRDLPRDHQIAKLQKYQMDVGGECVDPATGEWFESFNPYTGKPWALFPRGNAEDADRAVETAYKAFTTGDWPKLNASQRGALLRKQIGRAHV